MKFAKLTTEKAFTIGRSSRNNIVISLKEVSSRHAVILSKDGKYLLVDYNSANGVRVNGVKAMYQELSDKDEFTIASYSFTFLNVNGKACLAIEEFKSNEISYTPTTSYKKDFPQTTTTVCLAKEKKKSFAKTPEN